MARPIKESLSYFPFDTGFFSDRKIRRLLKTFGGKGTTIYNFLLCDVYGESGYFLRWDDLYAEDIADTLGSGFNKNVVSEVLKLCCKIGLFNKELFDKFSILTSSGIQKRYISAKETTSKKKYKPDELLIPAYNLLTEFNGEEREKTEKGGVLPLKEKKSKEKESKGNKKKSTGEKTADEIFSFDNFPENLRTDSFLSAWSEWEKHKKEIRKKLTPSTMKKQLKKLSAMGEIKAIQAINNSITNGWQGLFEPKQSQQSKQPVNKTKHSEAGDVFARFAEKAMQEEMGVNQ